MPYSQRRIIMAQSSAQQLNDLQAAVLWEGSLLKYGELAQLLGIPTDGETVSGVDFFNACMGVQSNEAVQALPYEERIRAIASAGAAMNELQFGR